jgi:hypothetical protein
LTIFEKLSNLNTQNKIQRTRLSVLYKKRRRILINRTLRLFCNGTFFMKIRRITHPIKAIPRTVPVLVIRYWSGGVPLLVIRELGIKELGKKFGFFLLIS